MQNRAKPSCIASSDGFYNIGNFYYSALAYTSANILSQTGAFTIKTALAILVVKNKANTVWSFVHK